MRDRAPRLRQARQSNGFFPLASAARFDVNLSLLSLIALLYAVDIQRLPL
jgi:hypothetical protein